MGGSASGAIGLAVSYNWLTLNTEHRGTHYKLEGEGWGLGLACGAGISGNIYTYDMGRLLRDTVNYQMNNAGVYANVNFFDSSGNNLGSLQSGSRGIAAVVFEGWGGWKKI
ncbi:VapA/VapB family virulence-associated protein [Plantibacter sp. YIM 135249]|uniref:VapA/VapB family virulence-associated protein n=1 Tax=Plantibacter sp. YIM 135249 TaxID=3423918 RepID=UPI003D33438A